VNQRRFLLTIKFRGLLISCFHCTAEDSFAAINDHLHMVPMGGYVLATPVEAA
jgi:hypothetical protein